MNLKKKTLGMKYVDMLNGTIPGNAFKIDRESNRVESRLAIHCATAFKTRNRLNRSASAAKRKEQEEKNCKLAILKNDIITIEKWEASITLMEQKLKDAKEEISNWKKKYENLEKEKEDLFNEMLAEVTTNYANEQKKLKEMEKENEQLVKYIDMLENESLGNFQRGAGIPDLKTRQAQNRKLKQLKTRAQKALQFVELFGLKRQCLKLTCPGANDTFTVDFNTNPCGATEGQQSKYESLDNDDKTTVESILFLMDKFGVGDEFVHELSMVVNDFPVKSYLIKQCRSVLNKEVRITTTPGLAPGAQYSFKTLLAEKIKTMVCYPFTPTLLICRFNRHL